MNDLINKAKELGIKLEVERKHSKYTLLRTLNDEVKQFELSDITHYKIKAIIDGKAVVISCESLNDVDEIIETLKVNAELLDNEDEDFLAKENIVGDSNFRSDLDVERIRSDLLNLNKYRKNDGNMGNIDSILESNETEILVSNTNGVLLQDKKCENMLFINVSYKDMKKTSDSSDFYLFKEYDSEDTIKLFERILDDAKNRLYEESICSQKRDIINNNSMFLILDAFKDMFQAKNINKGISILSDKYNTQICSSLINIYEDPTNEIYPGRSLFDSEGSRCVFKKIIDNGKFITKLYNNKESIKDNTESTGNADGVNNMILVPGDYSFDSLVKELYNGIIITDLMGLHSGVNAITGDMSLDARGYLVENGKITIPLNSILLSANIFEVLNNVKCIGNDLKFGSTSVGSPSILCENIMIVGEK